VVSSFTASVVDITMSMEKFTMNENVSSLLNPFFVILLILISQDPHIAGFV